ncbi:Fungal-trans domain-containing protein [Fusarium sp. LHS14.1]|nr:Fungal-trans domain-containing protein [Fusarium sp. LHS14.1]
MDAASSLNTSSPKPRSFIHRTRTGCRTCRHRKVKCDETKPRCTQCLKGNRTCDWSSTETQRQRTKRRPNATACEACRDKKLKCVGNVQDACERCNAMAIDCLRSPQSVDTVDHQAIESPGQSETVESDAHTPSELIAPGGELPTGKELQDLVQLYFSSVHQFGYFEFIHQLHFKRLLAKGNAPRELTLLMIASAMRFAGEASIENLAKADAWADTAIKSLLPAIYQGFGVIQLMSLLLAQHYDLNRGNFTSAWLLGSACTRMMQMMSLQTFDRTFTPNLASNARLSPLLSGEALRRVAWSTFFLDSIIDGGRYGFHVVDEKTYRLQLPCEQERFLGNENVVTEPLDSSANPQGILPDNLERAPLDMSAYLLRTAATRRRALHFAFRASHKEQTAEQLSAELDTLRVDIEELIAALPKRFHFNSDNMFVHRDRLVTFLLLHVMRHNLFIILGRAGLMIYQQDPAKVDLIPQVRQNRILHALPIAGLVSEGLRVGLKFDPQIGVHSYVALEILLFEPRRLAEVDPFTDPKAPELVEAIPHLLNAIRQIARRSEFVRQLHVEAVHRLLQCDCMHLLTKDDLDAFRSEHQLVGQDVAEYDFRDFRWAKVERLRRGASSTVNMARDEALLEYREGEEIALTSGMPSPRLDAMDVSQSLNRESVSNPTSTSLPGLTALPEIQSMGGDSFEEMAQSRWGLLEIDNTNQGMPLDWVWLLGGESTYQTY